MNAALPMPPGLEILGDRLPGDEDVLTRGALGFLAALARRFSSRVEDLLSARQERQARLDAGERLDFLPETADLRASDWCVAAIPPDLVDRRVEITGPVDRKMIINALNSGASVFMADFEDATSPTWENLVNGQASLREATRRTLRYVAPETGKDYALAERTAKLFVRPRGLHLPEPRLRVDGRPIPGALFDFGLYFFHNAVELARRGATPSFYIPKLESNREAAWWDDVFRYAQEAMDLPVGTLRATVLIETLPAAFEMHEILWQLRRHSAGLNCGRWDYIFSFIKTRRADPTSLLPDRARVGMTQPFLRAYSQLLIQTCHRRGVHAIGGMSALIPVRQDQDANEAALAGVRADKLREVTDGHDGTWVAHPGLVPVAREVMDAHMPGPHQIARLRDDVSVTADDLLTAPDGPRTLEGLRHNVRVGIQYLDAWLGGLGCVPIDNLMEDAATAEISRAQIWQWLHHGATLTDGRTVDRALVQDVVGEELSRIRDAVGTDRDRAERLEKAGALFTRVSTEEPLIEFLTLPAMDALVEDP